MSASLPPSRLYTLIDEPRELALCFLEGQRLIQDLALTHDIRGDGFAYFREAVLSIQPLIALLKGGEQLGFYIDSNEPYFRLKLETGHNGSTRSMLLPEDFADFPTAMRGIVRLFKLFPGNRPPYESVLRIDGLPLKEIVNRVLADSYQVPAVILVSETSDQSVLLHQLPPLKGDVYDYSPEAIASRRDAIRDGLDGVFRQALVEPQAVAEQFGTLGFRVISSREVRFHCPCSQPRMVENLRSVYAQEGDSLFDPGEDTLEVKCEYCKSRYRIRRDELAGSINRPH